jgi:hypothetical protein
LISKLDLTREVEEKAVFSLNEFERYSLSKIKADILVGKRVTGPRA